MAVVVKGLAELEAKLKKLTPTVEAAAKRGVYKAALKVEGDAKMIAPVDTGNLRRSITTSQGNDISAAVSTTVEYAPYVEFGTSRMQAQPYLRPSLNKNKTNAQIIVSDEIRRAIT